MVLLFLQWYYQFYEFDESNNNWQTDNIININQVKIIIRLVFKKGKKLFPEIYLDDFLYKS